MLSLLKIVLVIKVALCEVPSPLANALAPPSAAPLKKQGGVSEDTAEGTSDKKGMDKTQIRKLLSTQPDPSLLLEPPPEKEKKAPEKPKPPAPPAPPSPPVAGISNMMSGKSSLKLTPSGKNADAPTSPEVAVILVDRQFIPQRIRLKDGVQAKLFFTTINDRPAALVIEKLQIQRWVAKDGGQPRNGSELERTRWEVSREINRSRITEILINPQRGNYSFHDAISGARGQLIVE